MKRTDLVRKLEEAGCLLLRHGAKHDIFHNPKTGETQPVSRHRDINDILAVRILRDLAPEK